MKTDEAVFARDSISETLGAVFFDANGDGHPDLYVVSGGNEYSEGASALQDRLYLNDGHGHFRKAAGALPPEANSGSRVVAADYDGDGAIDLFVGGRVVPWQYGMDPQSMLLKNDGHGHFTDVTAKLAPELEHVGMVTDAVWRDVDGDGRLDLVVVGEWMPITIFKNMGGGRLKRLDVPGLEKSNGWWNRIIAEISRVDGRMDFIVGNLGLNGRLRASEREPVTMYVKDFDGQRRRRADHLHLQWRRELPPAAARRPDERAAIPHAALPELCRLRAQDGHATSSRRRSSKAQRRKTHTPSPRRSCGITATARSRSCRCRTKHSSRRCMGSWPPTSRRPVRQREMV